MSERPDLLILDVPATSAEAYARLLDVPETSPIDLDHVRVAIGSANGATESGFLVGVDDSEVATRLVERRGLPLTHAGDQSHGCVDGLTLGVIESSVCAGSAPGADITGVDHVVVSSPNRDRIIATLCGRLDFDLRLDRIQPWGIHQLFLRRNHLLVEVVLTEGAGVDVSGPDTVWGVAWRTTDIARTTRRLSELGVATSETRSGAKPGTRVVTIKDPALGLPTIVLEQT